MKTTTNLADRQLGGLSGNLENPLQLVVVDAGSQIYPIGIGIPLFKSVDTHDSTSSSFSLDERKIVRHVILDQMFLGPEGTKMARQMMIKELRQAAPEYFEKKALI